MFQAYNLDKRFESEKIGKFLKDPVSQEYLHLSKDSFEHPPLPAWLDWNISWEEMWIRLAAVYITYVWIFDCLLPFVLSRMKNTRAGHFILVILKITGKSKEERAGSRDIEMKIVMNDLLEELKKDNGADSAKLAEIHRRWAASVA